MSEDISTADRLKARLTGAVALLIIGAVAWVWLLDADSPVEPVAQESSIPPAPDIQPFAVPEPQAPADIKPVGSERDAPVVAEPAPAPATKPQTVAPAAQPTPAKTMVVEKQQPAKTAVSAKPPVEKFEMDTNNLPVAWVIQVGAMATPAAADKLRDQLIGKGFKAYTQPSKLANGTSVIKVFVGPKLSRERADAQKKAVDALLKTNTMVVRFPAS